jgi:hypothetical protein
MRRQLQKGLFLFEVTLFLGCKFDFHKLNLRIKGDGYAKSPKILSANTLLSLK